METHTCPKCNETMDEGHMGISGSGAASLKIGYVSEKQKGMLKVPTSIHQTRACPNCGYVEIYLDPKELKQMIKGDRHFQSGGHMGSPAESASQIFIVAKGKISTCLFLPNKQILRDISLGYYYGANRCAQTQRQGKSMLLLQPVVVTK